MIFRNWVLQNFPFIEDDFDSLTDYELFSKILVYIKKYEKEFQRIEKEIKEFEEYISTIDIERTINEILDVRLPLLEESIISQVDTKINDLKEEINETFTPILNSLDSRLESVENGDISVYNPTTGETETLEETLQDITSMIINTLPTAITCLEFDNLELTATDFDAYEITAINFDLNAKEILV